MADEKEPFRTIFHDGLFNWKKSKHDDPVNLHMFVKYMGEWGVSRALLLWVLFLGLYSALSFEIPHLVLFTLGWLGGTAPVWLPVGLFIGSWRAWVWYIQALYISGRNPVLMEIKIPREITKSPRAMEIALSVLSYTSGEVTFLHRAWRGQVRPYFSLELASFGGEVHFYIWSWNSHKHLAQSALYAQFPEIEIYEVEDYASKFEFNPKHHKIFGTDYVYDPRSDAFPIKSYVDFELDKDPKEEFKVDPLAQMFEYLSSRVDGEQVWIQIIFRIAGKSGGPLILSDNTSDEWFKRVKDEVERIREEASRGPGEDEVPQADLARRFPRPTWRQTEQIRILERNAGKQPYDVGMRGVYICDTRKVDFNSATYTTFRWIWKPVNSEGMLNRLRPSLGHNPFDYPWQDYHDIRWDIVAQRYVDAYRRRSAFHSPWITRPMVMTNETLASIFHFPSSTVQSPGIQRIAATKAEPPPNLPK